MLLELSIAQQQLGHQVHVIAFNRGLLADRLVRSGVPTTVLPESDISPVGLLARVRRICDELQPDVVHAHRIKETIIGTLAARSSGVRVCIRTVHGDVEHDLRWYQLKKRLARAAEQLTTVALIDTSVAVSAELGARLRQRRLAGRVDVIENGIDPARIRREANLASPVAPPPAGRTRVAIVGRLVPVKRVDRFLDACDVLASTSGREIEAVIVGDGPLRADLEARANRLSRVSWTFTGFVGSPASILRSCDLLAISSDHEGLPMCLLEAIALGVPVVARAVGGIPPLLRNGYHGRLVHSDDASEFAAAMQAVLDDARPRFPDKTSDSFPAELDVATTALRYRALYSSLAERHSTIHAATT